MGYKLYSSPTLSNMIDHIGCLAGMPGSIREAKEKYNGEGYLDLKRSWIFQRDGNNTRSLFEQNYGMPYTWELLHSIATEINNELGCRVFDKQELEDMLESGTIRLDAGMHTALVHARCALFRPFIEVTRTVHIYQQHKEIDVIGAFLAAHLYSCNDLQVNKFIRSSGGWDQSAFNGLRLSGNSLSNSNNWRRVIQFFPEYYKYFDPHSGYHNITQGYVVPYTEDLLNIAVTRKLSSRWFRQSCSESFRELNIKDGVVFLRKWFDTVAGAAWEHDQRIKGEIT